MKYSAERFKVNVALVPNRLKYVRSNNSSLATRLANENKSNSTVEAARVKENLLGHPLEMRSIDNDGKLDHSIENNRVYGAALNLR